MRKHPMVAAAIHRDGHTLTFSIIYMYSNRPLPRPLGLVTSGVLFVRRAAGICWFPLAPGLARGAIRPS